LFASFSNYSSIRSSIILVPGLPYHNRCFFNILSSSTFSNSPSSSSQGRRFRGGQGVMTPALLEMVPLDAPTILTGTKRPPSFILHHDALVLFAHNHNRHCLILYTLFNSTLGSYSSS